MENIRLATPEEIEAISKNADLVQATTVLAFPNPNKETDFAVIRNCYELDPVFFAETSDTRRRWLFIWGIENGLRFTGVPQYYFNICEKDKDWRSVVEHFGATPVSTEPEIRYKKVLR